MRDHVIVRLCDGVMVILQGLECLCVSVVSVSVCVRVSVYICMDICAYVYVHVSAYASLDERMYECLYGECNCTCTCIGM